MKFKFFIEALRLSHFSSVVSLKFLFLMPTLPMGNAARPKPQPKPV